MAIEIHVRQKGRKKFPIELSLLKGICEANGLQYGVPNQVLAFDRYTGGEDIAGKAFILYDEQLIGRGVTFELNENGCDCLLCLSLPCSTQDIALFYNLAEVLCGILGTKRLEHDGEDIMINHLPANREYIERLNLETMLEFIKQGASGRQMTVFGAVYPITPELKFYETMQTLAESKLIDFYSFFLHEMQKNDCYYAKPSFFTVDEVVTGMYFITQDTSTIFPINPEMPIFSGTDLKAEDIQRWEISFGSIDAEGELTPIGLMEYSEFAQKFFLGSRPHFDSNHVLIKLTAADMGALFSE